VFVDATVIDARLFDFDRSRAGEHGAWVFGSVADDQSMAA
jgi:hypothetical protein